MKAWSISKMNTIFGFLVPKMLEMSNFIDPTQLFQKLWGLFCNFQYLKVPLCKTGTTVTSPLSQMKNSNLNNSRNNENFDGLFDSSRKWETILSSEFPFKVYKKNVQDEVTSYFALWLSFSLLYVPVCVK